MSNTRHETSNQFKDGLLMDLHPLQTPNTVLTDNLNGTFITYNGNEYSLQNDMGNFRLKNCRLSPNYLPIGTTSYADTIYIVSYNPVDKKVEIGSYPSPVQYNETNTGTNKSFYTISESWCNSNINSATSPTEVHCITLADLLKHQQSVIFGEDQFRLKAGDECELRYDNKVLNGFETIDTTIIFDSGKQQQVVVPTTMDTVTWDTPGKLKVSSRIFDIEDSDYSITALYYNEKSIQMNVQYNLYVSDKEFIKMINSNKTILSDPNNCIGINCEITAPVVTNAWGDSIEGKPCSYTIIKKEISSWMGEYLKISFFVQFDIQYWHLELENKELPKFNCNLKMTPYYRTHINYKNITGNESLDEQFDVNKFELQIFLDKKVVEFEHTIDKSSNFIKVGETCFKWTPPISSDSKVWKIEANSIASNDGDFYYALYKISPTNTFNFSKLTWKKLGQNEESKIDSATGMISIETELDQDCFYMIFFKKLLYKYFSSIEQTIPDAKMQKGYTYFYDDAGEMVKYVPESDASDDPDGWDDINILLPLYGAYGNLEKIDNKKFINLSELEFDENVSKKIIFAHDVSNCPGIAYYDQTSGEIIRYDNANFIDVVKNVYESDFANVDINEANIESIFYTREDIKNSNNNYEFVKITEDSAPSKYHTYFKRYSNSEIDFPSFVKLSEAPSGSENFYVPKKLKIDNINLHLNDKELCNQQFESQCICDDGHKQFVVENNKYVRAWSEILGSIYVQGSFLFTDNLKFYRLNASNVLDSPNHSLHALTMDKTGSNSSGNWVYHDVRIADSHNGWSATGGEYPSWKSVDIQNYRTIRIYTPGSLHQSNYFNNGFSQYDYSWKLKKNSSICQYVSDFHKRLRNELDEEWSSTPLIKSNSGIRGEYESNAKHAAKVWFHARTLYRDKAQRPSFTNDSWTVNICPDWDKWTKTRSCSYTNDNDDLGVSAHGMFLALPYKNKLLHTLDYEDWWCVSGWEQHSVNEITQENIEMNGIGLIGFESDPNAWGMLNLYAVWVPGEPNKKYDRYGYSSVNLGTWLSQNSSVKFGVRRIVPDEIRKYENLILNMWPDIENECNIIKTNIEYVDIWKGTEKTVNFSESDSELLRNNLEIQIESDNNALKNHPIFKMVSTVTNPSNRLLNEPISGVYPVFNGDRSDTISDPFDGTLGFSAYSNFEVDDTGRVFLKNLAEKDNIYVRKNSKTKLFGYFPYLPNCKQWI